MILRSGEIELFIKFYFFIQPRSKIFIPPLIFVTLRKNMRYKSITRKRRNLKSFVCSVHASYQRGLSRNTSPSRDESSSELTNGLQSNISPQHNMIQDFTSSALQIYDTSLPYDATAQQTTTWLQGRRFSAYLRTFSSYSGADLLRLSRDDLIQICGLADGIRLFNALHTKAKTVYLCVQSSPTVYHAIYLANLSSREMTSKIAILLGVTSTHIHNVFMLGPGGIRVLISDELVLSIKDGATYSVETLQDTSSDRINILLKSSTH